MTLTGFGLFAALIIRSSLLIPAIEMGATGPKGQRCVREPKCSGPWGAALSPGDLWGDCPGRCLLRLVPPAMLEVARLGAGGWRVFVSPWLVLGRAFLAA